MVGRILRQFVSKILGKLHSRRHVEVDLPACRALVVVPAFNRHRNRGLQDGGVQGRRYVRLLGRVEFEKAVLEVFRGNLNIIVKYRRHSRVLSRKRSRWRLQKCDAWEPPENRGTVASGV